MITRKEANQLYVGGNVEEQVKKVENAIRKEAPKQKSLFLTTHSCSSERMKEQEKIYPNFEGLYYKTVRILKENGFTVEENNNDMGHSWLIKW